MIAEIIINSNVKKLNKTFDYEIPENLKYYIQIGSRVLVPFGNKKTLEDGYVINIKEKTEFQVKEIAKLQDDISKKQIELAKWMSKKYFANISEAIKLMLPPGTTSKNVKDRIKEKHINCVYLKKTIEEIEFDIQSKKIKSEKQIKLLEFLKENQGPTVQEIEMFTEATRAIVKTLEKNGYVEFSEKRVDRSSLKNKKTTKTAKLHFTKEQQQAYEEISKTIDEEKFKEFLIYGITGSGKTEIYLQLIEKVIKQNKTAIILVPEISLTPQMLERFISRFGAEIISVLHSKLSNGERYDAWHNIKEGKTRIVIGARSAIFAPMQDLGLIIIDEEHDISYKSETSPRYEAKEVAKFIAKQNSIPLVLGSATPDMTTYYKSMEEEIQILKLTKRANNSNLPEVKIVDLREELANGNRTMISVELYKKIEENLKNKHQTILFLNRRGYSTFVMCRDCGYTLKCKNCNISLTYHNSTKKLKCHYCGYEEKLSELCPECKSKNIRYFGTGTQKLEAQIKKIFPNAKTIRMDVDTVTKKNSHEDILNKFKNEGIDILIGTQMVVKGHHFPNVTLVGVIAADGSLNIEDYRANERTFQILTQVAGRAGRENLKGEVIIQTYNPENFSIQYSKKQDYELFFDTEIKFREQLNYPPFCDIILVSINGIEEEKVKKVSKYIYENIKQKLQNEEIYIFKPTPAPIDKIKNKYRWRIIAKGQANKEILNKLNKVLEEYYKLNQKDTRVIIDVNPNNMA